LAALESLRAAYESQGKYIAAVEQRFMAELFQVKQALAILLERTKVLDLPEDS
jgi:hypothetical protein